jgi:hypothetical protein
MAQRSSRGSWWAAAAVTVAVLLTVGTARVMTSGDPGSGRAGDPAGASVEPTSGSDPSGSTQPGSTPSVVRPKPSLVAPRDQPPRPDVPVTLAIQSYEVLAPDRLQVRYATGLPECYGALDRAVVKEADQEVTLVLVARPPTGPADQPCPDIAQVLDTLVHLDAPLGGRRVIDGVSGQVVRRGHRDAAGPDLY